MAETDGTVDETEEDAAPKKGGKKKLIIIIVAAIVILAIGGGAGAYFMGMFDAEVVMEDGEMPEPVKEKVVYQYYDMPEMLINLQADGGQVRYLKLLVSVEYEAGIDTASVIAAKPQIEDLFQTYLRELTPTELQGSMGVFRLREELLKRINLILAPERINGILFKKIVVQ
ncbi:MAG: flagellar basal body-associated FliL family protein [OCS116 cluster bacterium]|uniref:Flagellar protein FliL n=1 Tax=OCS116 cluster bacterium TaxID=2030921 RepID=A0A2A4Z0W1_9PROT|nr:flagellar basal body-associated FliL family protein [OCS116 cluster bacterium]